MLESMLPTSPSGLFDDLADEIQIERVLFHEALLRVGANHWGPLESFLIVEINGEPAGAVAAFPSRQADNRPLTPNGLKRVADHFNLSGPVAQQLLRRYIMTFGAFGSQPHLVHPADYVLEYGAKVPNVRERIFGHLIRAHAERALGLGYKTLGLIAIEGNDAAARAWEGYGARHHSTIGSEHFKNARPGMRRFVLDLPIGPQTGEL
jgi:hypothetical protein